MGTVVGIIDGTGSLGAAFGQIIVTNHSYSSNLILLIDWNYRREIKLGSRLRDDVLHDSN